MKTTCIKSLAILLLGLCSVYLVSAQDIYDHEILIKQLNKSKETTFQNIVDRYDAYLATHPNDARMQVEKLRFMDIGAYDEYYEENPYYAYIDSCRQKLYRKYPHDPYVLLFYTESLWGEDLTPVIQQAATTLTFRSQDWSRDIKVELYMVSATHYFQQEEYALALDAIKKAVELNPRKADDLLYAKILYANDIAESGRMLLQNFLETNEEAWELRNAAYYCIEKEEFDLAMMMFDKVQKVDSTYYLDKSELAKTLVGIGAYAEARNYLVQDTINQWDEHNTRLALFLHDMNYHDGDTCIASYNGFRDLGWHTDPIGVYRIKLLLMHPWQALSFRDLGAFFLFLLLIAVLMLFPSVWILPVYTIGHKWGKINTLQDDDLGWGLKSFWYVSAAYILVTFLSTFYAPESINGLISWTEREEVTDMEVFVKSVMMFILVFGMLSMMVLFKVRNARNLLPPNHLLGSSILISLGAIVILRIVAGIWVMIGVHAFGIELEGLLDMSRSLLVTKEDMLGMMEHYGVGISFLLIAIAVPVYEELVFRGVVLNASKRYMGFKWANIFQAFLFALVHFQLFMFPFFFLMAWLSGYLNRKYGGLLTGILIHILNNGLVIIAMSTQMAG